MTSVVRSALLLAAIALSTSGCLLDLDDPGTGTPDGGGGGGFQSPGHQTTGQSYTVFVYMVADNNLEPFALEDLSEMLNVGRTQNFRFVVQIDRAAGYTSNGIANLPNFTSTKRLVIDNGSITEVADIGEVNMGDSATLSSFITWGIQSFPADRYAMIFWDHGAAWPGFGGDGSTANDDLLSIAELKSGMAAGLQGAGAQRFALVGFDACLMATYEVALAMRPHAEYLLASEELEPGHGWDWTRFSVLAQNPAQDPINVSRAIIDGFKAQAELNDTSANITLSLVDLYALNPLQSAVAALAKEGQTGLDTGAVTIARSLDDALAFNKTPDPTQSSHMIDIGDLAARLAASDNRFSEERQQIASALQGAVLYRTSGPVTTGATGLSIYFPPNSGLFRADYDDLSADDVGPWRTFLHAFHGDGNPPTAVPTFTNPNKIADAFIQNGNLIVQGDLAAGAANNIAAATLLYGVQLNNGEIAILGDQPAQYEATFVQGGWDLSVLTVTQGQTVGYSYLSIEDSGGGQWTAVIPFEYAEPGSNEGQYCIRQLVFDNNNTLLQDTYYVITEGGVGELSPEAGGSVWPLIQVIDANGDIRWDYGGNAMDPWNIQLSTSYFQSGATVFGALTIEDSAGRGDSVAALAAVP